MNEVRVPNKTRHASRWDDCGEGVATSLTFRDVAEGPIVIGDEVEGDGDAERRDGVGYASG
jgi:hypothetical protein